jgi:hypothetical protein
MEPNKYPNLSKWTYPPDYMGADLSEYYHGLSTTRDAEVLTVSNYEAAKVIQAVGRILNHYRAEDYRAIGMIANWRVDKWM